jgi:hypothetical protein
MANATTTTIPSRQLATRIAALAEEGRALERPFLEFAARASEALRDFEAEVDHAGIEDDEQRLQDAARPLVGLHNAIYEMTGGFCDLLGCLGGEVGQPAPVAA